MLNGWYQVAFEREITETITKVHLNGIPLMVYRNNGTIRVFNSLCPHRGADLCNGGKPDGDSIICPFHGLPVSLDEKSGNKLKAKEYPSYVAGGLVFAQFSDTHDCGFRPFFEKLDETHFIVPGFIMELDTPPEMIIENAFDCLHFRPVHNISNTPEFILHESVHGEFAIQGKFAIPYSRWQHHIPKNQTALLDYTARAFSPGIVISLLGGENPYYVITTASRGKEKTIIRLSLAIPPREGNVPPSQEDCRYLIEQSRKGLEADGVIWETMDFNFTPNYLKGDMAVVGFRNFCNSFQAT